MISTPSSTTTTPRSSSHLSSISTLTILSSSSSRQPAQLHFFSSTGSALHSHGFYAHSCIFYSYNARHHWKDTCWRVLSSSLSKSLSLPLMLCSKYELGNFSTEEAWTLTLEEAERWWELDQVAYSVEYEEIILYWDTPCHWRYEKQ